MHTQRGMLTLKIFKPVRELIYKTAIIVEDIIPAVYLLLARVFLFAILDLVIDKS